jgi:hypothetical protein
MSYVQVDQSVTTHRKTLKLARLLGDGRYCVVGRLVALWGWSLDSAVSGVLKDVDAEMLAEIMGWQGQWHKPSELYDALLEAGFTELNEKGQLVLHNWDVRMEPLIRRREDSARRMRAMRARRRAERERQEAKEVQDALRAGGVSFAGGKLSANSVASPRLVTRNVTRTLRSKSNVEKNNVTLDRDTSLGEPERTHAHSRAHADASAHTPAHTRGSSPAGSNQVPLASDPEPVVSGTANGHHDAAGDRAGAADSATDARVRARRSIPLSDVHAAAQSDTGHSGSVTAEAPSVSPEPLRVTPQAPSVSPEPTSVSRPATQRKPDVLWDACVVAIGYSPSNDAERGKWNAGLKSLRQSNATPDEIADRAAHYRERFGPEIPLHPFILARQWCELAPVAQPLPQEEVPRHATTTTTDTATPAPSVASSQARQLQPIANLAGGRDVSPGVPFAGQRRQAVGGRVAIDAYAEREAAYDRYDRKLAAVRAEFAAKGIAPLDRH